VDSARLRSIFPDLSTLISINRVPDNVQDMLVIKSVVNSITAKYYEVMEIRFNSKLRYFWLGDDHSFPSSILLEFGFNISNCPGD